MNAERKGEHKKFDKVADTGGKINVVNVDGGVSIKILNVCIHKIKNNIIIAKYIVYKFNDGVCETGGMIFGEMCC
jgi:hypothetical protein